MKITVRIPTAINPRNAAALLAALLIPWLGNNVFAQGGDVLRETLSNGLRIVIVPNRLAPVVTTVMNYRVGSDEAPDGFPGMAHAQEHMMFRGSPGLSADQLAEIAAGMGGEFDADTQQTVTQYFFTVPSADLDLALRVEATRMQGVSDSEQLWSHERPAIEQEVDQDLSDPQYVLSSRLLASVFRGTPYAHDALGTRASFDKTTGAMLKKFYDTWYAPDNAILIVVGDVQPQQVLSKVKSLFGRIPSRSLPARPEVQPQPMKPEVFGFDTDLSYGLAVMTFRMPGSDSPDFAAANVLTDVLSSQRGELYGLAPAGEALSAGMSLDALPRAGMGYAVAAYPKGGDGNSLLQQVRSVLARYLKEGFPPELVEAAKRQEATAAELQKNSVAGLAMAWSQAVAIEGRQSPDDDLKAIEHVTAADVNRVARQYLVLDNAVTAILTPQPSGQPVSSAAHGLESFAPKQIAPVKMPSWAERALNRVSVPESTVHPVVSVLPNGIRLIVQPESVSHTVSVYGHIDNQPDLEVPLGKEGVSELLDQLFSWGSVGLDRISFQKALDDIGANESAGAGFSLQVLSSQFNRGVQLLADNELNAALPEPAFETVRRQLAASVRGQLESPGYLTDRAFHKLLFPANDPTLRQATPQTVAAISSQDVRNYYRKVFRPDLTTIVVMGDISPDSARDIIQKYFGQWKASGPRPSTTLPAVPLNKSAPFTAIPDSSRVQDLVIIGEVLGLTRSDPDYYALQLGNHVLGGGFYATRLYRDLRENGGLVYTVSSSLQVGRSRGLYVVQYACEQGNVYQARVIVERNLTRLRTTSVGPGELRQAKAILLRDMPLAESSVDRIADGLISRTTDGLPLDEPTLAAQRYLKLNSADVKAAFVKWIRVSDLVQVTEGPQPQL